jgi:hypothetical protein
VILPFCTAVCCGCENLASSHSKPFISILVNLNKLHGIALLTGNEEVLAIICFTHFCLFNDGSSILAYTGMNGRMVSKE